MIKHEPHKIKSVRNINYFDMADRKFYLRSVNYNTGLLPSSKVTFDMVSQGSAAMSQEQVAALFKGDEAYAGARNFNRLTGIIKELFNLEHVCPVHNRFGGLKLVCSVSVSKGKYVAGNSTISGDVVRYFGGTYHELAPKNTEDGYYVIDESEFKAFLEHNGKDTAFVLISLQGNGCEIISPENLKNLKQIADSFGIRFVVDASFIAEYAYYTMRLNGGNRNIRDLVTEYAGLCGTMLFDAGQGALSNVGGFLATNNARDHEKYMNEVVVYEGLHTYGGMAGRTMEVVCEGLYEMSDVLNIDWFDHQVSYIGSILKEANVPVFRGLDGVYLDTSAVLPGDFENAALTLAAALYLISGVRVNLEGRFDSNVNLPVLIPRRTLMNSQLEEIAGAVISLVSQSDKLVPLMGPGDPLFQYEAGFDWVVPDLEEYDFYSEPFYVHSVEYVGMKNREDREKAMEEAGYNTFLLNSEDVTIDFLTDSGTSAMSVDQWLYYLDAQETPSTPDAYYDIVNASQETYGYEYIILTHQGRAAEHIMSQMFIAEGDYVPGNMYFTTTKLHQEMAGGIFVDVIVDEAHDMDSDFMWKGNIDLKKLEDLYQRAEDEGKKIAYISFEFNVNMAGGQPVSMQNIRDVYAFCKPKAIPVFFDATRCSENACFIQKNDPAYTDTAVADILLEMFSYGDGATISCKKDMLTNLSGSLLFRDNEEWYREGLRMLQLFEGPYCSGGTSAGDMAAHAQGLAEMVDDAYINSRIDQTRYLGELLNEAGIPIVNPPGGHAIFLDAKKFFDHLDQDEFPAQMLASQIFIETGVRPMERGNVSKGRNPETGENYRPKLELVRLTIPRRVYTREHIRRDAEGIINLYNNRKDIKGLEFTYEPEKLRFFQSRFKVKK